MKEVARSGGVDHRHAIGGSVPESLTVPGKRALFAHRGADQLCAVFSTNRWERRQRVIRSAERLQDAERKDWEVQLGHYKAQLFAKHIEITHDRDARLASPGRRQA